jgi:hypothetical protein
MNCACKPVTSTMSRITDKAYGVITTSQHSLNFISLSMHRHKKDTLRYSIDSNGSLITSLCDKRDDLTLQSSTFLFYVVTYHFHLFMVCTSPN